MIRLGRYLLRNVIILAALYLGGVLLGLAIGDGVEWDRLAFGLVFLGLGVVQLARRRQQNLPWIG